MKKVFVILVALIVTAASGDAQIFVGGAAGVNFSGGKRKTGNTSVDMPKSFIFEFSPKAGYHLSEDFAVGLEFGILHIAQTSRQVDYWGGPAYDQKLSTNLWSAGAFCRYRLAGLGDLSLLLEGGIGFSGAKLKVKRDASTTDGPVLSWFNIGVLPVLSYKLSDRLNIEASCDFLSLAFQTSITTENKGESNERKTTYSNFGFGLNRVYNYGYNLIDGEGFSVQQLFKVGLVFKF